MDIERLDRWLKLLDDAPVECDGMARIASCVLSREGIEHTIEVGGLVVEGEGTIPLHYWIKLPDGVICDLRARMWLGEGEEVPHGAFIPKSTQKYLPKGTLDGATSPTVFLILAGKDMNDHPRLSDA